MGNSTSFTGNDRIAKELGNNFPDGEKFFGLINRDNICYSNSIFQAFFNCGQFKKMVLEYKSGKDGKDNPILLLQDLFQDIQYSKKKTGICSSSKIMKYVRRCNPDFKGEDHQDCHEFSIWFLNSMNDTLNKKFTKSKQNPNPPQKKEPSLIEDIFGGMLTTQTTCLGCKKITERDEPFLDLSIDMLPNASLSRCIRQQSEVEMMSGDDQFFCDTCKSKQDAEKRVLIKQLPKALICHLKRFKYDERQNRMIKLQQKVAFPLELKLSPNYKPPNNSGTNEEQQQTGSSSKITASTNGNSTKSIVDNNNNLEDWNWKNDINYQLNAVIIHHGQGLSTGHYNVLIKKDDSWYLYDDEEIFTIEETYINEQFGNQGTTACPYMLFYQKKNED